MIRKPNMYSRPKKPFEKTRILEENQLMEKYGLKNKKEIWKAIANLKYYRARAKSLAKESSEAQQVLFEKLQKLGMNVNAVSDVLALNVEDFLARRLPTILVKKAIATTAYEARQMVSHKRVTIDGKIVNIPSYLVLVSQEDQIKLKSAKKKKVSEPKEVAQNE